VARDGVISLQILVCDFKVGAKTKVVAALLNSCSNSILINQALASKLKAKIVASPKSRKVNYIDRQVEVKSSLVSFELAN
jgi:hypothetical protein